MKSILRLLHHSVKDPDVLKSQTGWGWLTVTSLSISSFNVQRGDLGPSHRSITVICNVYGSNKIIVIVSFHHKNKLNCIWSLAKRTFLQKLVYVLTTLFFFYKKTLHLYEHFSCNGPSENMHRHHPKGLLCQVHT